MLSFDEIEELIINKIENYKTVDGSMEDPLTESSEYINGSIDSLKSLLEDLQRVYIEVDDIQEEVME